MKPLARQRSEALFPDVQCARQSRYARSLQRTIASTVRCRAPAYVSFQDGEPAFPDPASAEYHAQPPCACCARRLETIATQRLFAQAMTRAVTSHPDIEVVREECTTLPEEPGVVATGPLTSDALGDSIRGALGDEGLAFYDAIAPIVHRDSLDESVVFEGGRFEEQGKARRNLVPS